MSLQVYYLVISILGWYWWAKGAGQRAEGSGQKEEGSGRRAQGSGQKEEGSGRRVQGSGQKEEGSGRRAQGSWQMEDLQVSRLKLRTGVVLSAVFIPLFAAMWLVLDRLTDSPVPEWDSFITSLSIIATWMLARKIYEHWFLWIVVNTVATGLFLARGLYPTVILYLVYGVMSFAGLKAWRKTIRQN
jgi:nicotinamide riboside transporter PnuC